MYILMDKDLTPIDHIDVYDSAIWAERHREHGDFELYGRPQALIGKGVSSGRFLARQGSDRVMFIENIRIDTDVDEGPFATVTGRSLECMLKRRVLWPPVSVNGTVLSVVRHLLESTVIKPSDSRRRIPNFVMQEPVDDYISETEMSAQFAGETVYDAIVAICEVYDLGFKIVVDNGLFVFVLYKGTDRSFNQDTNPYVVFSPDFDNIASSSYSHSTDTMTTFAYVAGEESDDSSRLTAEVDLGPTGLDRVELFVDAGDIRSTDDDGKEYTQEEYGAFLEERGLESLSENSATEFFESSMDTHGTFVYGRDFFLGDTVQIQNEFGIAAASQVLEIVYTKDSTGETIIPTFATPILN